MALRGKIIVKIACGGSFTACLSDIGALFTWGHNKFGQLGHGKIDSQMVPQHVTSLHGINLTSISCGKNHTIVLSDRGQVYAFGMAQCGQLGHKTKVPIPIPQLVTSLPFNVEIIQCASLTSMCYTNDGRLLTWGYISTDHLGLSDGDEYHSSPVALDTINVRGKIIRMFSGSWHSGIITNEGKVYVFGFGYKGRLGNQSNLEDDTNNPVNPVPIEFFEKEFQVTNGAAGGAHSLIIANPKFSFKTEKT